MCLEACTVALRIICSASFPYSLMDSRGLGEDRFSKPLRGRLPSLGDTKLEDSPEARNTNPPEGRGRSGLPSCRQVTPTSGWPGLACCASLAQGGALPSPSRARAPGDAAPPRGRGARAWAGASASGRAVVAGAGGSGWLGAAARPTARPPTPWLGGGSADSSSPPY